MVNPERELIGHRRDGGGGRVGAVPKRPLRIIGQRVTSQHGTNLRVDGDQQRVAREGGGIQALAFLHGRNRKHLRGSQHLAEPLVLPEEISPLAARVEAGYDEGPTDREAKFIASEVWNAAGAHGAALVKEVAGVERRVAQELEDRAVHIVSTRPGNDLGKTRGTMADFRWHDAGIGADLLNGVNVEIGESRPTQ